MASTRPLAPSRWQIAAAATALQLCLGTVYAWSQFSKPLQTTYGWSASQVQLTFSIAICFLGLAAAWGGLAMGRIGPRRLAMAGAVLFGAGHLLAGLALWTHSVHLLWLGYGVVGGIGLGLGYVTPVTTTAKWFPDRKGLATGLVIMGFGLGALLMSMVLLPALKQATGGDYASIFLALGGILLVLSLGAASFMTNPPAGYDPKGSSGQLANHPAPLPPSSATASSVGSASSAIATGAQAIASAPAAIGERSALQCLLSWRFGLMWLMFFCNIVAGISLISYQSPMIQRLWASSHAGAVRLEAVGAGLIAVSSLFNGLGRLLWGALSDRIGRANAFRIMLASQVGAFVVLICTANPWVFAAGVCYVLLCYGGGFGTMPSFVLDSFGPRRMPTVYGAMLTAWSAGGIVGPMVVATLEDLSRRGQLSMQACTCSFVVGASLLGVGLLTTLGLSNRSCPVQ